MMSERKIIMVPGPVNYEPSVLRELSTPTPSHMSLDFAKAFKKAMEKLRELLNVDGKVFILAGGGTLAMEVAAVNVLNRNSKALVVSTGVFGDRFADLLTSYGVNVVKLSCKWGEAASLDDVKALLEAEGCDALFLTHVDTSTSVLNNVKELCRVAKDMGCLTVVDGVAATGGIEENMAGWGIDVLVTASQKALGVPPGLAIIALSDDALQLLRSNDRRLPCYYASLHNWLPIVESFEQGVPAYFSTPPVNLIQALSVSLELIFEEGLKKVYERHALVGKAFREALKKIGLKLIPVSEEICAPTLTAVWYPDGVVDREFRGLLNSLGVVVAGGLGPYSERYFRIGHMGRVGFTDIVSTIAAVEIALSKCGFEVKLGEGVAAAQDLLLKAGLTPLFY
ncbi:MAG: alanine--glyoxylate aminotransferase family protein [Candidatus Methanomethylicota archaeon]|uniref:Alanine--glyoxylate aminotransferase family protein n=1 Tax=Thermoproteota archaeon TaxID=2056631 RepID=A0A497ERK5_9CREN|nr:MAG: alanine--glyoxylate aminotransferase family protein [Candidatus Verstraetearchaeota archaeon]